VLTDWWVCLGGRRKRRLWYFALPAIPGAFRAVLGESNGVGWRRSQLAQCRCLHAEFSLTIITRSRSSWERGASLDASCMVNKERGMWMRSGDGWVDGGSLRVADAG